MNLNILIAIYKNAVTISLSLNSNFNLILKYFKIKSVIYSPPVAALVRITRDI